MMYRMINVARLLWFERLSDCYVLVARTSEPSAQDPALALFSLSLTFLIIGAAKAAPPPPTVSSEL
eukprot:1356904-Amphidinium_carterae.1